MYQDYERFWRRLPSSRGTDRDRVRAGGGGGGGLGGGGGPLGVGGGAHTGRRVRCGHLGGAGSAAALAMAAGVGGGHFRRSWPGALGRAWRSAGRVSGHYRPAIAFTSRPDASASVAAMNTGAYEYPDYTQNC